ncbi:Uncharacterized protein C8034_v003585 [Colletotrichum sidae]|uniref:Carbohydrate kinase PfkB domain-containing protein n=1 Tax=Colletotrichum sidae TaxID=1347389 RepID=A0A4R8TSI2_9PEZI|nr:Uncharacterized protein C8034_v003585 [Colletotrichum sidae]
MLAQSSDPVSVPESSRQLGPVPAAAPTPTFMSLGMVLLDEIHFPDGRVLHDVPGGSGFYSTLGARLAVPPGEAASVVCLIAAGDDFPQSVERQIEEWGVTVHLQETQGKSTRGVLTYHDDTFEKKSFRYAALPLRPDLARLPDALVHASAIHILASPDDLTRQVEDLLALRANLGSPKASVVWEPSPLFCHLGVDNHLIAAGCVDVVSPNDVELLQIARVTKNPGESWNRRLVENAAAKISGRHPQTGTSDASSRRWVTVVRCGEHGNLTIPRRGNPFWLPPYHDVGSQRVVDATGAGNAFLGAFAAVFGTSGDEMLASAYGAVAASFAVEQVGPPRREVVDGKELWNGEEFGRRLQEYRARFAKWDTSLRDREIWTSNP